MNGLEMKYFVLKPKGDSPYAAASRAAMKAYDKSIEDENSKLCYDLHSWVIKEQGAVNEERLRASLGVDDD